MATLLHLDSSALPTDSSASRTVTALFREAWEQQHPEGTVIRRDLAAEPVPHLDAPAIGAGFTPYERRTPEQHEAFRLREELTGELERADAVVIGAPMYNYAIPSTLKAWLDHVIVVGRTMGTDQPTVAGKPVTVVASRGGSYEPGTPREGWEFVRNYLGTVLGEGMGMDVDFIVPELTLAPTNPAMSELVPKYEESLERAHSTARRRGKEVAVQLAG
ncbi:NAD(P)H-dependent oxidoreductase [Streptomyces sp. NPDC005438]|uniref:FMN-dependent NADH-azoreductase n=1 Tax=Streptomyces sp. NPDC005438 TaxID=3156880 RepID=UPI0033A5385E